MPETMPIKFGHVTKVAAEMMPTLEEFSRAMGRFRRVLLGIPPEPIERHAFTPDMDLRCSVPRCTLGIEAHR